MQKSSGIYNKFCIKRNAMGAANAFVPAELALAGIESKIPVDEVIHAMKSVGNCMIPALKETAEGGLAATPTAKKYMKQVLYEKTCSAIRNSNQITIDI